MLTLIGRHYLLSILCVVLLMPNLWIVWSYLLPDDLAEEAGSSIITLLGSNLYFRNSQLPGFASLLEREKPDLVLLTEFTPSHQRMLGSLMQDYSFSLERPRSDGFGIAVYSRLKVADAAVINLGGVNTPQIQIDVLLPTGREVRLYGVHLLAPEIPAGLVGRNRQIEELQQRLQLSSDSPHILLGDFNITPWSPYFPALFDGTELVRGDSVASWPVGLGAFGIPIDHCLHTTEFATFERRRGEHIGSDHYPLLVKLAL